MAEIFEATDVGKVRPTNEDSFLTFAPDTYIIADGMGGCAAGEVASGLLTRTVRETLEQHAFPWNAATLQVAVLRANEIILNHVRRYPQHEGMGTTATVFHREGRTGYWAHVGDSRLYLFRQGTLTQLTRDHSYVAHLVEQGSITDEEARVHPKKNLLTRAVGVSDSLEVDAGEFVMQAEDKILLTTDGLTNMVTDEAMAEVLRTGDGNLAECLINMALKAGGLDNVTTICIRYQDYDF